MCSRAAEPKACYSHEDPTFFVEAFQNALSSIQPNNAEKCTMLLVVNLAQPDWVSVNCRLSVLSHAVCFTSRNQTDTIQNNWQVSKFLCSKMEILFKTKCYVLLWLKSNNTLVATFCNRNGKYRIHNKDEQLFYQILFSTSLDMFSAASVTINNPPFFFTLEQHFMTIQKNIKQEPGGFIACHKNSMNSSDISFRKGSALACPDRSFSSSAFVCVSLATLNCRVSGGLETTGKLCQKRGKNKTGRCMLMFYKDRTGACQSFIHQKVDPFSYSKVEIFTCSNVSLASLVSLDDLIPDTHLGEDESCLKDTLLGRFFHTCGDPNRIPCVFGHPRCYDFKDICIYKLNQYNVLIPCRTGSHMVNCRKFECHAHLKCPNYYCIPWKYIRDGKWDCPVGEDETSSNITQTTCVGKFKCFQSNLCIQVANLCDNYPDCHLFDDEYMCELHETYCPTGCVCINLAVSCVNVQKWSVEFDQKPYIAYYIINCCISLPKSVVNNKVFVANLSKNSLSGTSLSFSSLHNLLLIDISHNRIDGLYSRSFVNSTKLSHIFISNSNISFVEKETFVNLRLLHLLDLHDNLLIFFSTRMFSNVSGVAVLNLLGNPLCETDFRADSAVTIALIFVDKYIWCLNKPTKSKCIGEKPRLTVYLNMLPSVQEKIGFPTVFAILTLINITAIVFTVYCIQHEDKTKTPVQSKGKSKNHSLLIIISTYGANILSGIHLLFLFGADAYFGNTFPWKQDSWKCSAQCATSFSIVLFCGVLLPLLLSFLSFARLELVLNPFDAKCKSAKFVAKVVLHMLSTSGVTAVSLSVVMFLLHRNTSHLCSPYLDPTQSHVEFQAYTIFSLSVQLAVIVFVTVTSILLVRGMKASQESAQGHSSVKATIYIQLFIPILAPLLSWLPSSIIYLVLLNSPQQPQELAYIATSSISHLHAVILPILFSLRAKRT